MRCPDCRRWVEKEEDPSENSHEMQCPCGTKFCYLCGLSFLGFWRNHSCKAELAKARWRARSQQRETAGNNYYRKKLEPLSTSLKAVML